MANVKKMFYKSKNVAADGKGALTVPNQRLLDVTKDVEAAAEASKALPTSAGRGVAQSKDEILSSYAESHLSRASGYYGRAAHTMQVGGWVLNGHSKDHDRTDRGIGHEASGGRCKIWNTLPSGMYQDSVYPALFLWWVGIFRSQGCI